MQRHSITIWRLTAVISMALVLPVLSSTGTSASKASALAGGAPQVSNPGRTQSGRLQVPERAADGVCRDLQQRITSEIASERAECQSEIESFEQCRSSRRELEGVEVVTCGLGLFAGVANGKFEQPLEGKECGVDKAPKPRPECSVPACESELEDLEKVVLARHGLSALPSC